MQQKINIPTIPQRRFLLELKSWGGAATPQELTCQLKQIDNSARQTCKRRGWVTFDRYYWRLTDTGSQALKSVA